MPEQASFSASLITQGDHRFYQLAMPSDVLAECTFVSTREEDPLSGFQRLLDEKRAFEIAKYIDSGLGTIPTSVILSAQDGANLEYDARNKTIKFDVNKHSFLILDGQHRVWGFKKAETNIRVPVIIYNELSRRDESRLFIDINSKQRGVPNELLLDIKKQADYESSEEELYRYIFDNLNSDPSSPLFGKLTPHKRSKKKISRVTFNAAMKNIYGILSSKDNDEVLEIISNYLISIRANLIKLDGDDEKLTQSAVFRAFVAFFTPVASRVKDRFGPEYTIENFEHVVNPVFEKVKSAKLAGNAQMKILEHLESHLKAEFSL